MEDYGSAAANGNSYTYQPWRKKSIEPTFVSVKEGVSTIGNAAFAGLKKLETVILPNNIIKIGEIAFYGCEKLRNIIIPDGVLEIGDSAFFGCSSLLEIYIPDSVRNIGHNAFRICNLQKVVIGSGVERVGCWAFDPSNSINFEYLGSKEEWENILFYSGNENVIRAISNNEVITEIIDGITYQIIENKAIVVSADENVKDEVIIRDEVLGFPVVLIDHSVFSNNKNITEVVIPNSVVEIGDGTFFMCENLTKISFSKNLRTIGDQAFL